MSTIMGSISWLSKDTPFLEQRVEMHRKSLDIMDDLAVKMRFTYGAGPIPYYRVEQGWSLRTKQKLEPRNLEIHSLSYDRALNPGAARNVLLNLLYESNYDWLICMDDDHALYEHYQGYALLWELGSPKFLQLAKDGVIVCGFPAYWDGFKSENEHYGKSNVNWLLQPTRHLGSLPFACIPNIVKYGKKPIYFDGDTSCVGDNPPEDLKFIIDWLGAGGRCLECLNMISKSCGNLDHSSLFVTKDERSKRDNSCLTIWAERYLKTKFPRNPALWSLREFVKRRNKSQGMVEIPRLYIPEI